MPENPAESATPARHAATTSSYSITMRLHTAPDHAVVGAIATAIAATSTIGLVIVAVLALVAGGTFFVLARRKPVTQDNVNDEQPAAQPVSA